MQLENSEGRCNDSLTRAYPNTASQSCCRIYRPRPSRELHVGNEAQLGGLEPPYLTKMPRTRFRDKDGHIRVKKQREGKICYILLLADICIHAVMLAPDP